MHIVPIDDEEEEVRRIELHSDWVLDVAYTADGEKLISASRDKSVKISSAQAGELLRTLDESTNLVSSVVADTELALAAGRAGQLVGYKLSVALQSIGIAGSGNAFRPVTKRDQFVQRFESQPGEVLDLALSGDRKRVAVAGAYAEVRVYQLVEQKLVARITDLPSVVYSVALDGDGTRLAIGTKQGQVLVYDLPSGHRRLALAPVPTAHPADP